MCAFHYRVGLSCHILLLVTFFCFTGLIGRSQWTTSGSNIYNTNAGFVGINMANPTTNFQVQGHVAASGFTSGSLTSFVQLWADNAIIWKNGSTSGGLRFGAANDLGAGSWSEKIRMTDAGSLGIGTGSPRTRLDVWGGNLSVTGADVNGTLVASSQAGIAYVGCNYLSNGISINPSGNVGIGTTSTGTMKLAVEGNIGARKVVVTASNPFPDYVFSSGYQLTPLDSVARYIRLHSHLSEMPSADSVAKNGLDLGGNQEALLKKIEELTLYIIEQDAARKAQD
ncbi:MAG: hypothetical protein ABUL46_00835, partial [Chitinophaga rupis]